MRQLGRYVEQPRVCSYLPDEQASLDVCEMVDVTPEEFEAMLVRGWRRFGSWYFRPRCQACWKCVGLRIVVNRFSPSRSQRRARRDASSLRRVVSIPTLDKARLDLCSRWHASREVARGWGENSINAERYTRDFLFPHPCARESAFYDGDRLVGLGLFDETPNAISAAYFFFDPDYEGSLGTVNVMSLIEDAQEHGREHVYLGFRVQDCPSLRYKSTFVEHELLEGRPAMHEIPVWRRGER